MIRINNFKVRKDLSEEELTTFCLSKYNIKKEDLNSIKIAKKSIDARNKDDIFYNYSFDIKLKNEDFYLSLKRIKCDNNVSTVIPKKIPEVSLKKSFKKPPVIIGAGPSGLFAALTFVDNGICPVIIEQGKTASQRQEDVSSFLEKRNFRFQI